jgi:hypothetical protein
MATVLESLGSYLQTNSQGTLGTNMFYGRMPDNPDVCITLYEYEGQPPMQNFGASAFSLEMPRVQVVTRASREDYPTARDKAVAIRALLAAMTEVTVGDKRILRVQSLGSVVPLGYDTNDRPKFAVNFQVTVAP